MTDTISSISSTSPRVTTLRTGPTVVDRCLAAIMASLAIYTALFPNIYENKMVILTIIYYMYDIPKTTLDFTFHHLFSISLSLVGLYFKINNLPTIYTRKLILSMEITTPFYMLNLYFNNMYTQIMFFFSFLYFRVYNQYIMLNSIEIYNEFSLLKENMYIPYVTYYGLYALNLYWFTIIIKKISKSFKDPSYIFCHKIIPFVRLFFPFNYKIMNFYSAASTYFYHEDIYTAIMNNNYNEKTYITPQTMVHSIVNSMVSLSSIEPCYYKYSIPIHLCKYIFDLDDAIPFGVDVYFYYSLDALIIYYIWILFRTIKPMYNLNPLAVHTLLLILRQYSKV
jgi:hypothetical protein